MQLDLNKYEKITFMKGKHVKTKHNFMFDIDSAIKQTRTRPKDIYEVKRQMA